MKFQLAAVGAATCLFMAGCMNVMTEGTPQTGRPVATTGERAYPHSTTSVAPPSYNEVTKGVFAVSPQAGCVVQGSLSGFKQSEMLDYVMCLLPGLGQWQNAVVPGTPHPTQYVYIERGAQGYSPSGCWYDSTVLLYCPADFSIYVGSDAAWMQYDAFGDAALAMVLGHELTHHFQQLAGIGTGRTVDELKAREQQADCGGGAFMAYAKEQGGMTADDIHDLIDSLEMAGRAEGSYGDQHGTAEERLAAFEKGHDSAMRNKLAACNDFVPGLPLVHE